MADHFCSHCGEKVKPNYTPNSNAIWCLACLTEDGHLIEKALGYTDGGLLPALLDVAKRYDYVSWSENIKAINTIPMKIKVFVEESKVEPKVEIKETPKEVVVISFCKKQYYGTDCACSKCGSTGQVLPFRDVFGYGKEKFNEESV